MYESKRSGRMLKYEAVARDFEGSEEVVGDVKRCKNLKELRSRSILLYSTAHTVSEWSVPLGTFGIFTLCATNG